ncbi:MAG: hypothetical protein V1779_05920 [bacterium]
MLSSNKLSNLQLEILKTYSKNISDKDLLNIQKLLSEYFLNEAEIEIEDFSKNNNITPESYNQWASEHNRIAQ